MRLPEGHHWCLRQRHLWGPDQGSRRGWLLDHLRQSHGPVSSDSGQCPVPSRPPATAQVRFWSDSGTTSALQGRFATWTLHVTRLGRGHFSPNVRKATWPPPGDKANLFLLLVFSEKGGGIIGGRSDFLHPALNLTLGKEPLPLSPRRGQSPTAMRLWLT